MAVLADLSWSPQRDGTCRVRSPWWELLWHPVRGLTQLKFGAASWQVPAILGLRHVCTNRQLWSLDMEMPSDTVIQENRITASWPPTPHRPIELHARWVLEGCRFWLEISLLTPSRLAELTVETQSQLGDCATCSSPALHPEVLAWLLQPQGTSDWSYLELAHRREACEPWSPEPGTIGFRLFHEDLEKGVVLRGQLLATFLRRQNETELARHIAQEFAQSSPSLSR